MDIGKSAVEKVFSEKKEFIVVGLTGQKGSGCSTVCHLLQNNFKELAMENVYPDGYGAENDQLRDKRILYRFAYLNWEPFDAIKVKDVIMTFILQDWETFKTEIGYRDESFIIKAEDNISAYYEQITEQPVHRKEPARLKWDCKLSGSLKKFIDKCGASSLLAAIREYNDMFINKWSGDVHGITEDDTCKDCYVGLTEKVHFFKQTLFPASQNSNSATAKFYTKEAGASYPGSLPEIEAQSHIHW